MTNQIRSLLTLLGVAAFVAMSCNDAYQFSLNGRNISTLHVSENDNGGISVVDIPGDEGNPKPTPTPTHTPPNGGTPTPTVTPTTTPTVMPTPCKGLHCSPTPTPTPCNYYWCPSPTPTETPTGTPTVTPTETPTVSPSPTVEPTPSGEICIDVRVTAIGVTSAYVRINGVDIFSEDDFRHNNNFTETRRTTLAIGDNSFDVSYSLRGSPGDVLKIEIFTCPDGENPGVKLYEKTIVRTPGPPESGSDSVPVN